jgi:hypothetical protein
MAQGDFFTKSAVVSANGEFVIDGSTAGTGAVELHTFAVEKGARVKKEVDVSGDGTFEISIQVVSDAGGFHSQKNKLEVSSTKNVRVRIEDRSGEANGMHVTGIEVAD